MKTYAIFTFVHFNPGDWEAIPGKQYYQRDFNPLFVISFPLLETQVGCLPSIGLKYSAKNLSIATNILKNKLIRDDVHCIQSSVKFSLEYCVFPETWTSKEEFCNYINTRVIDCIRKSIFFFFSFQTFLDLRVSLMWGLSFCWHLFAICKYHF